MLLVLSFVSKDIVVKSKVHIVVVAITDLRQVCTLWQFDYQELKCIKLTSNLV